MATTQEALRTEERILTSVEEGKGTANPIIAADTAPVRLQEASDRPLNPGQLAAASLILSSADRTVSVQGVAGAGKSTMLQAVARVAEAEGRTITGLAFQNKMVADLAEGAGIKAQTIEIGIAHVCTPVTNAHLVCRPLPEKKKTRHVYTIK